MMGRMFAWIAARLSPVGARLVAFGTIALAVLTALAGMKRSAYKKGRSEERERADSERLREVIERNEEHARIAEAMDDAAADGPHTRDDVLERLRVDREQD